MRSAKNPADTEARLFADVHEFHDGIDKVVALANQKPSQYGQFPKGIQKIKDSGRLDMNKDQLRLYNKRRRELIDRVMADVQVAVTLPFNVKEMLQRNFNPQFVIFDEVSFFRDPDLFHVLGQLREDVRVLLVGDYRQLSPPVFTPAGESAWSKSAFERLIEKGYYQTLLNISYRSYKDLYEPASVVYYEGKADAFRNEPSGDLNITANPLRDMDSAGALPLHLPHVSGNTRKDPSGSLYHQQEAELGICLAQQLLGRGIRSILSMPPYRAQVWVHIGKEIPPLAVTTIELTYTAESRAFHREAFLRIITVAGLKPKRGGRGPKPTGGATVLERDTNLMNPHQADAILHVGPVAVCLVIVEMFADALSLRLVAVRASMISEQRNAAVQAFTSADSTVQVFSAVAHWA
ncbi:hypothetical protein ATERTT37_000158 [Aspergillus terreus]